MKKPDLKPCPFCGENDALRIVSYGFERYGVDCLNCQVKQGQWHGLDVALDAWNRRKDDEGNA